MGSDAIDTSRPFSRTAALRAGIAEKELRSSAFRALHHGIYIRSDVEPGPAIAAAAAIEAIGGQGFASHASAARIWGLPIPALPNEHITVIALKDRRQRPGICCHHTKHNRRVQRKDGVLCSSPVQTFVELATLLPLVDLVVVGDHMVRHGLCTLPQLRSHCRRARGPGAKAARVAAAYVREHVDSPMETRTRMLIVLAGIPTPIVNLEQTVAGVERRFDLCWPEAMLIVEYDGRHHIERERQWADDLRRREAIEAAGWTLIVLVAADIYASPATTLERIARPLASAGLIPADLPLLGQWRAHFQDRTAA